jgi:hypothetical protein
VNVEDEIRAFVAGYRDVDVGAALRGLHDGMDLELVVTFIASLPWTPVVLRDLAVLPVPVIRAVLARPREDAEHLFLRLAVDVDARPDEILRAWRRALGALAALDEHAFGSAPSRWRIGALARDPVILAAVQGAVANRARVGQRMLAVLVADGGAASLDALVPHVDAALVCRDGRLDKLAQLRRYAADKPVVQQVLAGVDRALAGRAAGSPALELVPLLDIAEVRALWFDARLVSRETRVSGPRAHGQVVVDSRKPEWFAVTIEAVTGERTRFTAKAVHEDRLKLGRCRATELPAWLARAATRLRITWREAQLRSSLRGTNRARLAAWLAGDAV